MATVVSNFEYSHRSIGRHNLPSDLQPIDDSSGNASGKEKKSIEFSPNSGCAARASIAQLSSTAAKGDRGVIATLVGYLDNSDGGVRWAAVNALGSVVVVGDAETMTALVPYLDHAHSDVRLTVLEAIGRIAVHGDSATVALLSRCLGDPVNGIKRLAVEMLTRFAVKGDSSTAQMMVPILADLDVGLRRAAVDAIAKVAPKGDAKTTDMLIRLFGDVDGGVRRVAVEVLSKISVKRRATCMELDQEALEVHEKVLHVLILRLNDSVIAVKWAAVQALGAVAAHGDAQTTKALKQLLDDSDAGVKMAAARVLEAL